MSTAASPRPADSTLAPVVSGRVAERGDSWVSLKIPGGSYVPKLVLEVDLDAQPGDKITGTLHAVARRIDKIKAGGRFLAPVAGRPRRVQGVVVGGHVKSGLLYVSAGVPFVCILSDERQHVSDFEIGQMVSFDVEPGTVFKPAR
ncbi:MAG: hypothetical protein V3V20_10420 [Algisphaera sp.]